MGLLSSPAVKAIVEVVTGGPGLGAHVPKYGTYRSGPKLEGLLAGCGLELDIAMNGRTKAVQRSLLEANERDDAFKVFGRLLRDAVDPREIRDREQLERTVVYVNEILQPEGLELRSDGGRFQLARRAESVPAVDSVAAMADALDLDKIRKDTQRALDQVDGDPEDSITAACSMLESTCRAILHEMNQPLPSDLDLSHLYYAVQKALDLHPTRSDVSATIGKDVKQVLGGLSNVASGVAALRTHAGDAHGKSPDDLQVDSRFARLALNAASTAAQFLIETWQMKK